MYPIPASKWETYPTVVEALERLVPDGSCEAAGEQLVSERAGHPKRQRRDLLALAEVVGAGQRRPYFFVQVRATREGFTATNPQRLKVKVAKADVRKMVLFRAPTYVVGVDEPGERAYVIAIYGKMKSGISSLSTQ